MDHDPIVIVGAGHAGVQAAASLREEGIDLPIKLLSSEPVLPYERPPLSKQFLQGKVELETILLRAPSFYSSQNIDLITGDKVMTIDRHSKKINLCSSSPIHYSHLLLATGSSQRTLPVDTTKIDGILSLRSLADATQLRDYLARSKRVVVIGAGFIGLEFSSVALSQGCSVDVVELGKRVLARAVSSMTSKAVETYCLAQGAKFHYGEEVLSFEHSLGKVSGVTLASGKRIEADLVLVGVGGRPMDKLAADSGLPCSNGIEVDDRLATVDPDISAIGDCCFHPNAFAGKMLRLESVQNAVDQARVFAKRIAGIEASYNAVPWFWSDMGEIRLQMAGFLDGCDEYSVRGHLEDFKFSIYGFRNGVLAGVESINRPADHLVARRLLTAKATVSLDQVSDETINLLHLITKR